MLYYSDVVLPSPITPRDYERERQFPITVTERALAGVNSHTILLSTVQYLYVHFLVFKWAASRSRQQKKKGKKNATLNSEMMYSSTIVWLGHSTRV